MAEPTPIPLGLSSSAGRTTAEGGAILTNCYIDRVGEQGKSQYPIYAADGFEAFSTLTGTGVGAIRGMFPLSSSALYVSTGTRIAKVAAAGTFSLITGTLAATGLVSMAQNRKDPNAQIAIAMSSNNLYVIENDTLSTINLALLEANGTLLGVVAVDGYFVLLFSSGEFFISGIDSSSIDPLDFAKAEANPDGGVFPAILGRDLIIFGNKSTEFWLNSGATDFPFERTLTRSYGCYAAGSISNVVQVKAGAAVSDTLVFAATDSQGAYLGICYMQGTEPVKISTPEIDRLIIGEANPDALVSMTWSNGERSFYSITGAGFSFVYDFSTSSWHKRVSNALAFWRVKQASTFGTKTIVGDYTLAKLYTLRSGLFNAASASVLTFRHSNDGGANWVSTRTRAISGAADLTQRVRFERIGRVKAAGKTFELSISNAVMEDGVGLPMTVRPPIVHAWPQFAKLASAHIGIIPGASQTATPNGILNFALQAETLTQQAHE